MSTEATSLASPELSRLLNAARAYHIPLLTRSEETLQLPYEVRSIVIVEGLVIVGDKSGSMACFSLDGETVVPPVRISKSSLDHMIQVVHGEDVHGVPVHGTEVLIGTRAGELYHVFVATTRSKTGRRFTRRVLRSFDSPITGLLYRPLEQDIWVGLENGTLIHLAYRGHPLRADVVEEFDVGSSIQQITSSRQPAEGSDGYTKAVFVATKLGQIHLFSTPAALPHEPWASLNSTINCLLSFPSSGLAVGLFVGTNSGITWVGRDLNQDPDHSPIQVPVLSDSRTMSLCLVPTTMRPQVGCSNASLIAASQDGKFHFIRLPSSIPSASKMLEIQSGIVLAESFEEAVFTLRSLPFRSGRGHKRIQDFTATAHVACGTRDHKVKLMYVVDPESVRKEMFLLLGSDSNDPAKLIEEALDRYPYDHRLRAGIIHSLLDYLSAMVEGEVEPSQFPDDSIYTIALRCMRHSSPDLRNFVLQRITALAVSNPRIEQTVPWLLDLAEYIEKYLLGGWTFATKRVCLRQLAEFNRQASEGNIEHRNYLDYLIYASRMASRHGADITHDVSLDKLVWDLEVVKDSDGSTYLLVLNDEASGLHVYRIVREGLHIPLQLEHVRSLLLPQKPDPLEGVPSQSVRYNTTRARKILVNDESVLVAMRDGRLLSVDLKPLCRPKRTILIREILDFGPGSSIYSMIQDPRNDAFLFLGTRDGRILQIDTLAAKDPPETVYEQRDVNCLSPAGHDVMSVGVYSPIWDLKAICVDTNNYLAAATTAAGALVFRRSSQDSKQSGITATSKWAQAKRDADLSRQHANCVQLLKPLDQPRANDARLVVGFESGEIRCYDIADESDLQMVARWGYRGSEQPVRDAVLVLDGETPRIVMAGLDSWLHIFDLISGRLIDRVPAGLSCNRIVLLGRRRSSEENCDVVSFALGGEARTPGIALEELTPASHWDLAVQSELASARENNAQHQRLLRRASSCDLPTNPLVYFVVAERYECEGKGDLALGTSSRIENRIRGLLADGYHAEREDVLLSLIEAYFKALSILGADLTPPVVLRALRLWEDCRTQWSSFGSEENDRVQLVAASAVFTHLPVGVVIEAIAPAFVAKLRQSQILPIQDTVRVLLRHPSDAFRYEILNRIEAFAQRLDQENLSSIQGTWLFELVLGTLSAIENISGTLSWLQLHACRILLNVAQLASVPACNVLLRLMITPGSSFLYEQMLFCASGGEYEEHLAALRQLALAVECRSLNDCIAALVSLKSLLNGAELPRLLNDGGLFDGAHELENVVSLLLQNATAQTPIKWEHLNPPPLIHSPPYHEVITQILNALSDCQSSLRKYGSSTNKNRAVILRLAFSQVGAVSRFVGSLRGGLLGSTAAIILSHWTDVLLVELRYKLPLAELDTFGSLPPAGSEKALWKSYVASLKRLFEYMHLTLNSHHSFLYVAHEARLSKWEQSVDATAPKYDRALTKSQQEIMRRALERQSAIDELDPSLREDPSIGSSPIFITSQYTWSTQSCFVFNPDQPPRNPEDLLGILAIFPSLLQAQYTLRRTLIEQGGIVRLAMHNLKTPVHTFHVWLSELATRERDMPSHERRSHYSYLLDITEYLSRVVKTVVDSRKETRINRGTHDIAEIAVDAARLIGKYWSPQGVTPVVHPPKRNHMVVCDRDKMMDVFCQLIDNACKYSLNYASVVHIEFSIVGSQVRASVIDKGIGIPQGEQERIFDWAEIGIRAQEMRYDGSGIGLYVVRKYVLAQDGKIEILSTGEIGEGSIFTLYLPRPPRRR